MGRFCCSRAESQHAAGCAAGSPYSSSTTRHKTAWSALDSAARGHFAARIRTAGSLHHFRAAGLGRLALPSKRPSIQGTRPVAFGSGSTRRAAAARGRALRVAADASSRRRNGRDKVLEAAPADLESGWRFAVRHDRGHRLGDVRKRSTGVRQDAGWKQAALGRPAQFRTAPPCEVEIDPDKACARSVTPWSTTSGAINP